MSDGSRRSGKTLAHHGCGSFEEHETGDGGPQTRVWTRLSLQASCGVSSRQAGSGVSRPTESDLRARMLLASPYELPLRNLAKISSGILGSQVRGKRSARPQNEQGTEETRLVGAHRVAVSAQRSWKVDGEAR